MRIALLLAAILAVGIPDCPLGAQEAGNAPVTPPAEARKPVPREIIELRAKLVLSQMQDIELHRIYERAMTKHGLVAELKEERRKVYAFAPSMPVVVYIYSRVQDDPAKRRELLDKYRTLEPQSPWYYVDLGEMALDAKDTAQAAEQFAKAQTLASDSAGLLREIGAAYRRQDMPAQAIEWYEQAAQREPAHLETQRTLLVLYYNAKRYDQVVDLASRLAEQNPRDAWYWNMHGLALQKSGRADQARAKFLKAVELSPKWATPAYNLGMLGYNSGDWKDAAEWFKKSTQLNPRSQSGWHRLCQILYKRLGDYQATIDRCVPEIEYFPTDTWMLKVLWASFDSLGRKDEATVYREIILVLERAGVMTGVLEDLFEDAPTVVRGEGVAEAVENLSLEQLTLLSKVMPAVCKEVESQAKILLRGKALQEDIERVLQKKSAENPS